MPERLGVVNRIGRRNPSRQEARHLRVGHTHGVEAVRTGNFKPKPGHICLLYSVEMAEQKQTHIHEIDALRGIAAVLVACVFHQFFLLGHQIPGALNDIPVISWLYRHGWTMVDLFFVVSGFVFSHVYLSGGALRQNTTARSFAVARFARLYPLHILTVFLLIPPIAYGASGGPAQENLDLYHFALNLLMLQGSALADGYNFSVVSWSVTVEVFCYVLFFIAARAGGRALPAMAVGAILAGLAFSTSEDMASWYAGRGLCGFFAGYFAWRLRNHAIPTSLLVICLCVPFFWAPSFVTYGVVLGLTAFPAAVLLAQRLPILSTRLFRWFGERSYSIYLLHPVIYFSAKVYIPNFAAIRNEHALLVSLLAILTVIVVSDVSFRWFESPMRRLIRDKLDRQPESSGMAAQTG